MGTPQIILIVLWSLTLGIEITRNSGKEDGIYTIIGNIIGIAIMAWLLWWGGYGKNCTVYWLCQLDR